MICTEIEDEHSKMSVMYRAARNLRELSLFLVKFLDG